MHKVFGSVNFSFFFLLAKYSGSENIYSMKMSHFVSHSFNSLVNLILLGIFLGIFHTHLIILKAVSMYSFFFKG